MRPIGIARGLTFLLDHADVAAQIHCDRLAPGGYVYFIVAEGQATMAVVLARDFAAAKFYLRQSVATIEALYRIQVPECATEWGGTAAFEVPMACVRDGASWVGEAAGFQDALFGFGIRTAMVSGALAAASIVEGRDYEAAWRQRLYPYAEASRVNRLLYERFPLARRLFWHVAAVVPDGTSLLRQSYRRSRFTRLASWFLREA